MGPQRRMGIYVGFESPSIIRYLEPTTGDLFTARFVDCHFDENTFPNLGGDKKKMDPHVKEITWNAISLSHLDPKTKMCEQEVQRIIHSQNVANQLPDAFTDTSTKKVVNTGFFRKRIPVFQPFLISPKLKFGYRLNKNRYKNQTDTGFKNRYKKTGMNSVGYRF